MKTQHISRRLRRFLKANEAVSALEYAVLVGVVVVGVGGAIYAFSGNVETAISEIGSKVEDGADAIDTLAAPPTP